MRGSRPRFALRRRASAWLGIVSLFGLFLIQPFHGQVRSERTDASVCAGASLALSSPGSHAPEHDANTCEVCRAVSQVRVGLRAAVQLAVSEEPLRPLHVSSVPSPGAAPDLRESWPRAPPALRTA